jgi:hypothetical protein
MLPQQPADSKMGDWESPIFSTHGGVKKGKLLMSSTNVGKGYLLTIKVGLVVRETLTDVREN